MANTRLLFLGETEGKTLECLCFEESKISFTIETINGSKKFIILDRNTAIKLSKTIKTEISKMVY